MKFDSISPLELVTGEPIAFDVFNSNGDLLLSRGSVVSCEATRSYLVKNSLRLSGNRGVAGSIFFRMDRVAERLLKIEEDFSRRIKMESWVARVKALAKELIEVSDEDPHASFAVMHLDIHHSYDVLHHAVAGLVCSRLALATHLSTHERISLVCAAITHDIGLIDDRLHVESSQPLSIGAKLLIQQHCIKGRDLLLDAGVADALWLKVVEEHHERLDGSGYAGLAANQLDLPTRIMTIADSLSAMLRMRPYRDRILANRAVSDLYTDTQGRYDKPLITYLIREFGLFPPGSILRLASRETAICIRPSPSELRFPVIAAIADHSGRPMFKAVLRNARLPETSIVGLLPPEKAGRVRKILHDCWNRF